MKSNNTETSLTCQNMNSSYTMDKAVFLLLRLKKAFRKKKEKGHVQEKAVVPRARPKPPLVRAKTLPAIIAPGLTIIQTQMDCGDGSAKNKDGGTVTRNCNMVNAKCEDLSRKPKGSPAKVTFMVNHSGTPWKSSNSINPSSATMVTSPRISPSHSSASQVNMCGTFGNEKLRCDQAGNPNSWLGFTKLARFLNQREKEKEMAAAKHAHCRRTQSLENDDLAIRKASSIDSLVVEPGYEVTTTCLGKEIKSIPPSPSIPARLERPCPDLQSSPSLHSKLTKSRAGWSRESMDYLVDGLPFTKAERKKLEKFNKINIHMHALFLAVEHQHLEKARTILDHVEVDINSLNSDGFNALDIAVFTQNVPMSKLLLSYGAKENTQFKDPTYCANYINGLVLGAEQKVENLTTSVLNAPANSNISTNQVKEGEKQLTLWERRFRLLKKMKLGYEQTRPPDPPSFVTLHVVGTNNLKVEIEEPDFQSGAVVTKYKVEWSCCEDFEDLVGEEEIYDLRLSDYTIGGLKPGLRYYVQVQAGNVKGFSQPKASCPTSAVPSIWRDVDGRPPRSAGRLSTMEELFNQIRNSRPEYASEIKGIADQLDTPAQQRKNQMKKSIKSLFTPAPKFHKQLKRGVFLASTFYNEDRVLVTTEEYLPIVEVDETYPSSLHTDFHWMMKVACTWDDVKSLRQDMDKSLSSSTVHFRSRLLQAAAQMQSALGVQDLGQFFYKPLKDSNGTIVISTVYHVRDIKMINAVSMKWVPISKLRRKIVLSGAGLNAGELLLASISEQIQYSQMSGMSLHRGLYLGYLKVKSSMDLIRVLVPEKNPNVPPHYKIRDNPHVSCEEWQWLTSLERDSSAPELNHNRLDSEDEEDEEEEGGEEVKEDEKVDEESEKEERKSARLNQRNTLLSCPSEVQLQFGRQLLSAAKHLFAKLKVAKEEALYHRIYDVEVIELSPEVAFILVLPSVENVCSVPGHTDEVIAHQGLVALPVQIFEMVHMSTYQHEFISRYSRLSSILEMDTVMAQHAHREAFSSSEVASAKLRLSQLQEFQGQVDNTWKGMRWIMDVLTYARDRQVNGGVRLLLLYDRFDIYSPLPDSANFSRDRSYSPSPNPSISSGRSMESVHFPTFRSYGKLSLPVEKGGYSLQVPIPLSPTVENKRWAGGGMTRSKSSSIPKSYSDSFSALGIRDVRVTVTDDSMSSTFDLVSLTPSLRSVSSGEIPFDEAPLESLPPPPPPPAPEVHLPDADVVDEEEEEDKGGPAAVPAPEAELGILRVYAAYETGLGGGASIKLHVTPATTAREVINLVVKQLNMAAAIKERRGPLYAPEQLNNFCLVAVIGARERCLRDDFCPLRLQNPWTNGRLYVRMKHDVLAALQQPAVSGQDPTGPQPASL